MLERLQTIAKVFSRLKPLLLLIAFAGLMGFGLSLFESPVLEGRQLMMPSLVILFWATASVCFAVLFENIPPASNPEAGYRQRWSVTLRRGGYWLLGSFMILLSLSLVVRSYQLIRTWFML